LLEVQPELFIADLSNITITTTTISTLDPSCLNRYFQLLIQYLGHRLGYQIWNGSIKANIVNALAKAAAFTQINLFLQIEARENAYKEREEALQDHKLPMRGFDYVPPSGS
jgi:hypothetical protein